MTQFGIQESDNKRAFVVGSRSSSERFSSGTPVFIRSNFFPNAKFENKTEQNGLNFR